MQKWVTIDEKYLDDLRTNVDSKIPRTDYGREKLKPFFGELFEVDELVYVTQISHAQPRHFNLKSALDFYKLYIPSLTNPNEEYLAAVVNLNYMLPVPRVYVKDMVYKDIDIQRKFKSNIEKSKYIDLLKNELVAIQKLNLEMKAKKLYDLKKDYPLHRISKRCLDFQVLEQYARDNYLGT